MSKPNILVLGADHLRHDAMGWCGNPAAITPNLDALAAESVRFSHCFTQAPVCAPARHMIVGFAGGRPALAKTNHLLIKDVSVIGYTIGGLNRHNPAQVERNSKVLMSWLASGRLTPYVSHRLPLERTAEALQLIIDREVIGKAVVMP